MQATFPMVAKTFKGLEEVLRDELIALGAQNVEIGLRMVSFEGDLEMMYKANLCCRTALRILKPILKFTASDPDELYDCVRDIEWEKYLSPDSTFAIDSTVNSADFTHSKFVTYRVKDGIADHFNDLYGRRPSIRLSGADVIFNVHIADNRVTISLDSSGEPLSKRGYRLEATEAPLNEVLAAGIIMKTGWRGDTNFIDPMCGSGTFLIEAALIAANINPGIYRPGFAFEKWPDFDAELFERLYNDDSEERKFNYKIYGGDIDPEAVAIARTNVKRANLDEMIEITCRPFEEWESAPQPGILVTNPPYGERLRPEDIGGLYRAIGTTLKRRFQGYHAWILGYADEHFASIGLKPSVKFPLLNGALECSLREYVLFDGSYNDFRSSGGTVHNEDFDRGDDVKVRHLSDKDWDRETRRFGSKPHKFRDEESRKDRPKSGRKEYRKEGRGGYDRDRDRNRERERDTDRERRPRRDSDRRDSDRRPQRRDGERRDFGRRDEEKRETRREARRVHDRGPRLPEGSATVFSKVPIRSRRRRPDKESGADD